MEQFFQAAALVLLAVVMILILKGDSGGIGQLLSVLACCMVVAGAIGYIRPVITFVNSMQDIMGSSGQFLTVLLKVVGVSVTAEIASLLCDDAGNSALGKGLQFLATAVILWLSLPILTSLIQLIEGILDRL